MHAFTHLNLPSRVIFGHGTIARLKREVVELGCERALVLSTPGQEQLARRIANQLQEKCVDVFPFARMHTPTGVSKEAAMAVASTNADCLVAVGGGSAIGLSKAIALRTDLTQIAIPTTYSGSEMTSVLGETADGTKTTVKSMKVLPELVLYDVDLTLTVPSQIASSSGMNAIAHGAEALYAQERSPLVDLIAEEGITFLANNLPQIARKPDDKDARAGALYGAWLCGLCLATGSMGLHHKLCHVLGGTFGLPHAQTHAALLPHTLAYNAPAAPGAMRRIAYALNASEPTEALYQLNRQLRLACSLRELGLGASDIEAVADMAMKDAYWNPRSLERAALIEILERAYQGLPPLTPTNSEKLSTLSRGLR